MRLIRLVSCLVVGIAGWLQPIPSAAMGLPPRSGDFAYGARLDPLAAEAALALNIAASLGLDWIAVDFDWTQLWPAVDQPLVWEHLDAVMSRAQATSRQVMLSISNPPDWAMTTQGPDPDLTARLVLRLAAAYPSALGAVELFPAANTLKGWGTPPDASAYSKLLRTVGSALRGRYPLVVVVAGGLLPLEQEHSAADIQDLSFLEQLYAYGAAPWMPVLSLRLEHLTGDPLQIATQHEPRVLRRYEDIRLSMLAHNHSSGQIWITGYAWPDTLAQSTSQSSLAAQSLWLNQAVQQMRSQLYIGVAFFTQLTPAHIGGSFSCDCYASLLLGAQQLHPAAIQLARLISLDRSGYYPFPAAQAPIKVMPKNYVKVQNT